MMNVAVDDDVAFLPHQVVVVVPFNDGGLFIDFPCPTFRRPRIFPCKGISELCLEAWTYLEGRLLWMATVGTIMETSAPMVVAIIIHMYVLYFHSSVYHFHPCLRGTGDMVPERRSTLYSDRGLQTEGLSPDVIVSHPRTATRITYVTSRPPFPIGLTFFFVA